MKDTPTPESDEARNDYQRRIWRRSAPTSTSELVPIETCRRLERERDEWKAVASKQAAMHDQAERERDEAREPKWQPIETAPKDGTKIIVFESGQIMQVAWGGVFGDTWQGFSFFVEYPTHWQPLPTPPEP